MLNMEIEIFSREVIKPSSKETHRMKPFKLSLFDQLTPTTYATAILFYSSWSETNINTTTVLTHLKMSLSETLNIFYPFSGRVNRNMFIDRFGEGVLFLSARVNCRLSEFLKYHEIESLNKLLPCQPFTKEAVLNNEVNNIPLLVCQVTQFYCGGIALGLGWSHKITDAQTAFNLVNVWGTICRGSNHNVGYPSLLGEASLTFPPRNEMPQKYLSIMENMWFTEGDYITKRFTFDAKAIVQLRAMAKGENGATTPSKIQAISGFIWKCYMEASRQGNSGSSKPSILVQAVSLRRRRKPNLLDYNYIGNLFWWASCATNLADQTCMELSELVELMTESVAAFDEEYLNSLQGEEGFEAISEYFDQLETMFSTEKPDIFAFTSWLNTGFYKLDFGWGSPQWVAPFGKVGSTFRNFNVLIETRCGKGIEAWITIDEKRMSILEKDPEFLKFASPIQMISSL